MKTDITLAPDPVGNGQEDLVDYLQDTLKDVLEGRAFSVSILTVPESGPPTFRTAWRDDLSRPYPVILAAATEYQHQLLNEGL